MTEPFDFAVHKPVKGGAEHQMTEDPYIMLGSSQGQVLLRHGKFWGGGGIEIDPDTIPWVWDVMSTLSEDALASVGFSALPKRAKRKPVNIEVEVDEVDEPDEAAEDAEIAQLEREVAEDLAAEEARKQPKAAKVDPTLVKGAKK